MQGARVSLFPVVQLAPHPADLHEGYYKPCLNALQDVSILDGPDSCRILAEPLKRLAIHLTK